ncbi:hypothetical protein ACLKA7_005148 [Drosophila subpalustris]
MDTECTPPEIPCTIPESSGQKKQLASNEKENSEVAKDQTQSQVTENKDSYQSVFGEFADHNNHGNQSEDEAAKKTNSSIMEHIFNMPLNNNILVPTARSTLMSEILFRQQQQQQQQQHQELFQQWSKLEDAPGHSAWDRQRERDALLARIYSSNYSQQQEQKQQQQQQLLATQLLYAQFLQQPKVDTDPERDRERRVHLLEFSGLKKTTAVSEESTRTVTGTISQDSNNNYRNLGDIELDRREENHVEDDDSGKHLKKEPSNAKDSKSHFFREQKNILFDIKKGLEKWTLLCSKFQHSLSANHIDGSGDGDGDKLGDSNAALELTVQRQLKSNRKKIESMLMQVRRLYHQWSSAELYYVRSLQRLGLTPDMDKSSSSPSSPTHDIMALAAIALSAETASDNANDQRKEERSEATTESDKPRTLQDIENIILSRVLQQQKQQQQHTVKGYSKDSELEDSDEGISSINTPRCIWHPRVNKRAELGCSTAAEIILEYASKGGSNPFSTDCAVPNGTNTTASDADNCSALNLSPVTGRAIKRESEPGYLLDIQFPPTPATPPTSSNSSCSTGPSTSTSSKYHHRRKSRYARRIDIDTATSAAATNQAQADISVASLPPVCPPAATTTPMRANSSASSAVAVSAVAAFQERALTDMFKAQFSALTAAASIATGTGNGNGTGNGTVTGNATANEVGAATNDNCDHLPIFDAPYDLSIGTRLKKINLDSKSSSNTQANDCKDSSNDKKKPHIKKPLNAFMLYMKEMRAKVVAECTLKESAAINQILGRRWHALGREEQAKYYELARRERQLHMQMYPDWSSRTNATRGKKRKRKPEASNDGGG